MKTLIFSILLTGLGSASAAENVNLDCADWATASFIQNTSQFQGRLDKMSLRHNYASAELVCDLGTTEAVKEKRPFRCAGLWHFDTRRTDGSIGTIAVVEFQPIAGKEWTAAFTTSHDYERKDLAMECSIALVEH